MLPVTKVQHNGRMHHREAGRFVVAATAPDSRALKRRFGMKRVLKDAWRAGPLGHGETREHGHHNPNQEERRTAGPPALSPLEDGRERARESG